MRKFNPNQSKLLRRKITDGYYELGDVLTHNLEKLKLLVINIAKQEYKKGIRYDYYIHVWFAPKPHDPNEKDIIKIHQTKEQVVPWAQSRKTRPSPYQMFDHYLWKVTEEGERITSEWNIPKKEILSYIIANPSEFDPSYVAMLRKYLNDKIENIEDYIVDGKTQ